MRTFTRGFSMLEMLVVVGMFFLLAGFGLVVNMDAYRSTDFRSERDLFVALLQRARSQSMSNMCAGSVCEDGLPHGVHIEADRYVAFQGGVYNAADEENIRYPVSPSISRQGGDITFTQLSGTTTATSTTLSDLTGKTSMITTNAAGQISWSN